MGKKMWVLLELVEESGLSSSYEITHLGRLVTPGFDQDLPLGKQILVQKKNEADGNLRRVVVLRMSEDKNVVKAHKMWMERQDNQMQSVLQMCMRTIKQMKSEPPFPHSMEAHSSKHNMSRVIDSEDAHISQNMSQVINYESSDEEHERRPKAVHTYGNKRHGHQDIPNVSNRNIQSVQRNNNVVASTPIVTKTKAEIKNMTFDQATQTDESSANIFAKVEQLECLLSGLYNGYMSIVDKLAKTSIQPINPSDVENNLEADQSRGINSINEEIGNEENIEPRIVETNGHSSNAKALHVRRVSAHTTNTVDQSYIHMANGVVPIGEGRALIPARLLNEINWKSYTNATRQLLQAVFSRRMLATHSLSGKPSPAFSDRPAKKRLDPAIIDDIVETVSMRCGVPKNLVRTSITVKCMDEAKMYRIRQDIKLASKNQNQSTSHSPVSSHSSNEVE